MLEMFAQIHTKQSYKRITYAHNMGHVSAMMECNIDVVTCINSWPNYTLYPALMFFSGSPVYRLHDYPHCS